MTQKNTSIKRDLYQEVTNKMIALLENGVAPWRCTWNQYGLARNFATGHVYTGINYFLMNLTPHPIPYFMSFKQVKAKGGKIRKGAKAEAVLFYKTLFKDDDENFVGYDQATALKGMGAEVQTIPMLKYYNVFNIEDIEGIEFEIPEVELKENERIEKCEAIIKNLPNAPEYVFEDANKAYYAPKSDKLNMPDIKQFETAENYYSTFFHELTHSTGHSKRLNREGITKLNPFGSKSYSKEELIAEMGASFLSAYVGINYDEITENSAAYLKGWLKVLKADKKLIFKAAAEAQKAVDYILQVKRKYED
ncbi:MAG: DNA primase [Thermodesulfobacteriota bacterium]|nr:MAG: DNA primase [Thermodesulfobacteriota bacterium]GJM35921.1 MAG: DNA primase [Saprospiraceae bacterium]